MESSVLDLSYLYEVSGNESKYVYEIICLFLENVPSQLAKLEQFIKENAEFPIIQKQAHSLKSSVLFVKIEGLYNAFYEIETLARQNTGREQMKEKLNKILATYQIAIPLLYAERDRCNPSNN